MEPVVVTTVIYRTRSELPPRSIPRALVRDERRLLREMLFIVNIFLMGLGFVWVVTRMPPTGARLDAGDTVRLLARKIGDGLREIYVSHLTVVFPRAGTP